MEDRHPREEACRSSHVAQEIALVAVAARCGHQLADSLVSAPPTCKLPSFSFRFFPNAVCHSKTL